MSEKLITLNNIELIKLFGTTNRKLEKIKSLFPKIKIIVRGEKIKIIGSNDQISYFEDKLNQFIKHLDLYNSLTVNQIERIFDSNKDEVFSSIDNVITYGRNGKIIKARTLNQRKMIREIVKNDMIFAIGPAGTGKTYTAVAIAVNALKQKQVKRIVLTRPAIEAGENLGFLPGDLKEKLDPYMQPIYDALFDMIPLDKLNNYIDNGTIQIAPLAFMRGRTLDNSFVILDEGQNATENQMKMFLTRMGTSAKFIITGDLSQIDLSKSQISGLLKAKEKLNKVKGISFIYLDEKDVIRHKLVKQIIKAYKTKKNDENN
ncbi:MAG: phosphate starvation-inducible protein PhoH [Flavobacteriales bacterium]|nr:phosphate starvation-inducible protein PhoH [Flavobacteriales bacterium]